MIVGILSDTHGNVARTAEAARILAGRGVQVVIHCGDVCGEGVLAELASVFQPRGVPVHAVLGNCDREDLWFPEESGVVLHGRFADLRLNGRRAAVLHGDNGLRLADVLRRGKHDYVFTGHTHETRDERVGPARVINPGALHRARPPTVAVLDTEAEIVEFLALEE